MRLVRLGEDGEEGEEPETSPQGKETPEGFGEVSFNVGE